VKEDPLMTGPKMLREMLTTEGNICTRKNGLSAGSDSKKSCCPELIH